MKPCLLNLGHDNSILQFYNSMFKELKKEFVYQFFDENIKFTYLILTYLCVLYVPKIPLRPMCFYFLNITFFWKIFTDIEVVIFFDIINIRNSFYSSFINKFSPT